MKKYREPNGGERLWLDPGEIDRIMEGELEKADLHPTQNVYVYVRYV